MINRFISVIKETATCGTASVHNIQFDSTVENNTVIIESTVHGKRREFEQPQRNTSPSHEESTLKGTFLKELVHRKAASTSMIKTERTKCDAPVYYDGDSGWIRCYTFISLEEFNKLKEKIIGQA